MVIAQYHKYQQDPLLRDQLFDTYRTYLVEATPSDVRWGIARGMGDRLLLNRVMEGP